MSHPPKDPYLLVLEAKDKDLVLAESEIKRDEEAHAARGQELSFRRQRIEAERQAHAAAVASYTEFLKSNPATVTAARGEEDQEDEEWSGVRLRMGDQRRSVLLYIAKTSRKENGSSPKLTIRAIASATEVPNERVSNIVWKDVEREYLVRHGESIRMTDLGFELLKRAGVLGDSA